MKQNVRYANQITHERCVADYIPYSSHVSENTIITKDGDLVRIWRVGGIAHESADDDVIQSKLDQLNTLYRGIAGTKVAIWAHNLRRRVSDRLEGVFENELCSHVNDQYYNSFAGYRMMANELYFTLVYRPEPTKMGRALRRARRRTTTEIKEDMKHALRKVDEIAHTIEASMRQYDLKLLEAYDNDKGVKCSEALEFLNYLISGEWQQVRIPEAPLNEYLGTSWIFVGTETIEIRTPKATRYAQIIDFKDYNSHTEAGLLNSLMYEGYEYIITQSFSFMTRNEGKKFLERQQRQLSNAEDGAATQIEEMTHAIDQLVSGEFAMGEYHYSLLVYGDTVEEARKNTTSAIAVIQELGFLASVVTTATDAAYYAQLPCNWFYRPRIAGLTSRNFAGLASFHNFSTGKREGNPWGEAVTLLKTPSGQPYYFNFHASPEGDNSEGKKALGNTRIIGQSGSGKTVLLGMLLYQAQKYKVPGQDFITVFFDKDRGAEIAIRAIGGKYLTLENGVPTGFNPFQMEPTQDNLLFLDELVIRLVAAGGYPVSITDKKNISNAIRTVMQMPLELRRLSTVTQNITEGTDKNDRENSVVKRLSEWCQNGKFGWVFDNPYDVLDFSTHTNYGFDGTAFLDNASIRTPLSMYLLHRMEQIIDGRRFIYFMDEFWKWLLDDAFSDFAFNKQKTIRKQNGLGIFATQSPHDVLSSPIARAIVEQCATEIYLPNPRADRTDYIDGFKVSESEFTIIKSLHEDSRMFLIKQGQKSAIAGLDLKGSDVLLAILSGTTENVILVEKAIKEYGDDPADWLPVFYRIINENQKVRLL